MVKEIDNLLHMVDRVAPPDSIDGRVRQLSAALVKRYGITLDDVPHEVIVNPNDTHYSQLYSRWVETWPRVDEWFDRMLLAPAPRPVILIGIVSSASLRALLGAIKPAPVRLTGASLAASTT